MHTRSSARCGNLRTQHAPRCNRGPTICVHACMLRNRAANSPPESCGRQLLISASHCRDWDMLCVARGRIVIVIGPSKCRGELMRAICICRCEMAGSPWESSNVLVPAARPKCRDEIMSSAGGRLRRAYEFLPSPLAHAAMPDRPFHCMSGPHALTHAAQRGVVITARSMFLDATEGPRSVSMRACSGIVLPRVRQKAAAGSF